MPWFAEGEPGHFGMMLRFTQVAGQLFVPVGTSPTETPVFRKYWCNDLFLAYLRPPPE